VEVLDLAGDRVGVGVRDVHPGVAEAHAGEGRRDRHVGAAWSSSPCRTAVRNEPASSDSAFSDHMSEIGFEPQYGTRCCGALRSLVVYQRAV
jgi:hypothetical protein